MNVILINPYELGRQPFGLAEPAAWLQRDGCTVRCCDLSIQKLEDVLTGDTELVAIYIAMHTATRIAVEALPKIRSLAPRAELCVYGLYAPMNAGLFRSQGVNTILGGEFEPGLLSLVQRIRAGEGDSQTEPVVNLEKIGFIAPSRDTLPPLDRYASLILPDGTRQTVGFAETTRGCKYHCRHCPVVPVYRVPSAPSPPISCWTTYAARLQKGHSTFPSVTRISSTARDMHCALSAPCITSSPN